MSKLQPIASKTLSSQVEERLRAFILSGALLPSDKLTETYLADELNVSRGPLREAMLRLIDDGLLVKQPYKGIHVRPTNLEEFEELKTMRLNLESFAFREAWPKRSTHDLAELDRRCAQLVMATERDGKNANLIDCEVEFHNWAFEVADHKLLLNTWNSLTPLLRLYLATHQSEFGFHNSFAEKAQEFCNLAKAGDLDAMLVHLRVHLDLGMKKVVAGALQKHKERSNGPSK